MTYEQQYMVEKLDEMTAKKSSDEDGTCQTDQSQHLELERQILEMENRFQSTVNHTATKMDEGLSKIRVDMLKQQAESAERLVTQLNASELAHGERTKQFVQEQQLQNTQLQTRQQNATPTASTAVI